MYSEFKMIIALLSVLAAEGRYAPIANLDIPDFTIPKNCTGDFCFIQFNENQQRFIDELIKTTNYKMFTPEMDPTIFAEREGDNSNLCEYDLEMREAYYIKDMKDQWRVVVQSKARFIQTIHMRFCKNPGRLLITSKMSESVFNLINSTTDGYFYCDQQYYKTFEYLVLTKNMKSFEHVRTKNGIPVACNCVISDKKRE